MNAVVSSFALVWEQRANMPRVSDKLEQWHTKKSIRNDFIQMICTSGDCFMAHSTLPFQMNLLYVRVAGPAAPIHVGEPESTMRLCDGRTTKSVETNENSKVGYVMRVCRVCVGVQCKAARQPFIADAVDALFPRAVFWNFFWPWFFGPQHSVAAARTKRGGWERSPFHFDAHLNLN